MLLLIAVHSSEQLSLEVVIIVACVCGAVVLILTVILIVLCCRRHQDSYEKTTETYIGNTLDCPVSELTQLRAPTYRPVHVKSNNLDMASTTFNGALDQDHSVGHYSCNAEHTNDNASVNASNIPLQKVQNIDNVQYVHDCRLAQEVSPTEAIVGVDDSSVTMTTGDKRQKKIIYEVIV